MDRDAAGADDTIALCLSGGGFRATLFHLGVIRALRSFSMGGGMALLQVREIYSVSGGSILAAHFLRNHDRYTGTEAQFSEVWDEIIAFVRRDVRNRVLRRWGLTWWLRGTRSYWLQKEYESLLGTATIGDCYKVAPTAPRLHILATSFVTGELCSFSGTRFEQTRRAAGGYATNAVPAGHLRLAYAVAASSSFPPMFPPVPLTPELLRFPEDKEFAQPIELSDGGVYDNFGIDKFRQVYGPGPRLPTRPATLVVSHAGGSFDAAPGKTYSRMLTRNIRASDIMMRRIGEGTLEAGQNYAGKGYALVRIGTTVEDGTLDVATQQLHRLVRTDLNAFNAELSRLLVDHGCRTGCSVFESRGWAAGARPTIEPAGNQDARLAGTLRDASRRAWWPLVFDLRDWAVLILWWILAACTAGTAALVIFYAFQQRKTEQEFRNAELAAKSQALNDVSNQLERVRAATQIGNLEAIRKVLAGAIASTEQLAADPRTTEVAPVRTVTEDDANRIIAGTPSLPSLERTQRQQLVYIQFAGLLTRAQVTALNAGLKEAGWRTQGPSGERTPAAAGLNEVRYSGTNSAAAAELAAAINRVGLTKSPVISRQNPVIMPNVLEVWISD